MRRREALALGGGLLSALSAGCLETLRREDAWRELVVDPPDGVYVPSHDDEMLQYGTTIADGRTISLFASRPHSFWTIVDAERSRADVRSRHALHLMVEVRDVRSGVIVPSPVAVTIQSQHEDGAADEGEPADRRTLWPMLSQRMGPHYGDNVSLAGDGTYTASVQVGPVNVDATGAFAERFAGPMTVEFEFAYDAAEIESLARRLVDEDEGRGEPGALEPMDEHGHESDEEHTDDHDDHADPEIDVSDAARIGSATGDDIEYTAARLTTDRTEDATPSLAVTTRTTYNRYSLLHASLSATVADGGRSIASLSLRETIDPIRGHHYAAPVDSDILERGDELSITLESPPQVARHEGYETAFLDRETVSIALDER
ncbi:iron transporter [Natrialbaceae archaeon A-arb3/5]